MVQKIYFYIESIKFFFLKEKYIRSIQNDINYNFVSNKEENSKTKLRSIINAYKYDDNFSKKYFEWRLFQHDSPLTFFAYDNSFKNVVTFSIGLRGHIPFLRIISVIKDSEETLEGLLKSTEIFASKIGNTCYFIFHY